MVQSLNAEFFERALDKDNQIFKITPYSLDGMLYALPTDSSVDFHIHMAAAILSYTQKIPFEEALNSLDKDAYQNMGRIPHTDLNKDKCVDMVTLTIKTFVTLTKNDKLPSWHYLFLGCLSRLIASFESAVIMLKFGYYIEVSSIYRVIYEQLSWACFLLQAKDEEEVKRKKVTDCIKYLKKLNPKYGKLYGLYSNEVHLNLSEVASYYHVDGSQNISIQSRSGKKSTEKEIDLYALSRIVLEVIQHSLKFLPCSDDNKELILMLLNANDKAIQKFSRDLKNLKNTTT
ncbi:DUF5677 domain-containing protein [Lysinibacillus sp. FSL K6-0232]|uniref:DUF5677 domain-containing protein n=1 Tax=Lysinibacillus sp. FSL K6-0232 TaxID=2921425 RepID=UPI0030F9272C